MIHACFNIFFGFISTVLVNIKKLPRAFYIFLQLQLFITLISWPILLMWGLPLSIASPIGNFIFAPFLTVFLLLASLIFFCELCYIPNIFLIELLERFNALWLWFLSLGSKSWLICYAQPSMLVALSLVIISVLLLHARNLAKPHRRMGAYLLFIGVLVCFFRITTSSFLGISTLECFKGNLTLINTGKHKIVIDPGILGRRNSAPSWVAYTLIPHLAKLYGTQSLDYVLCLKPSKTVFKSLTALCTQAYVRNLMLISWQGSLDNVGWGHWQELLSTCTEQNTNLIFIDQEPLSITDTENNTLTITPETKIYKKNKLCYNQVHITGIINNSSIDLLT